MCCGIILTKRRSVLTSDASLFNLNNVHSSQTHVAYEGLSCKEDEEDIYKKSPMLKSSELPVTILSSDEASHIFNTCGTEDLNHLSPVQIKYLYTAWDALLDKIDTHAFCIGGSYEEKLTSIDDDDDECDPTKNPIFSLYLERDYKGVRYKVSDPSETTFAEEIWRGFLITHNIDPDGIILRFLRARKWDLSATIQMLLNSAQWRFENCVFDKVIKGDQIVPKDVWEIGEYYSFGMDKQRNVITYDFPGKHFKYNVPRDYFNYCILSREYSKLLYDDSHEKNIVVVDLKNITFANYDSDAAKVITELGQTYYPETLSKAYLVNFPWIFSALFKVFSPFLDPYVLSKVQFVNNTAGLLDYIDNGVLLKEYGGDNAHEFAYIAPTEESQKLPDLAKEKLLDLMKQFLIHKKKFVQATRLIHSVLKDVHDSTDILNVLERNKEWIDKREESKLRLRKVSLSLNQYTLPSNPFHRRGILNKKTGVYDWTQLIQMS